MLARNAFTGTLLVTNLLKQVIILTLVTICLLESSQELRGQQVTYSLQRLNPALLNPANTGSRGKIRGVFQYRNQQSNSFSPYNRTSAVGEINLESKKEVSFGAGAGLIIDKSSPLGYRSSTFMCNGALHIPMNNQATLRIGGDIRFYSQELNITNTNRSVLEENNYLKDNYPDNLKFDQSSELAFGTGIVYSWVRAVKKRGWKVNWKFESGLSAQNVGRIRLKKSEGSRPISNQLYRFYATSQIPIEKKFALIPSAFVNLERDKSIYVIGLEGRFVINSGDQFNSNIERITLDIGVLNRIDDALVMTSFVTWGDYALGVAYEMPVRSPVESLGTTGAFEMVLRYQMNGRRF